MKLGRKAGIERRPIEYMLIGLALLLTALLLWSLRVIRRDSRTDKAVDTEQSEVLKGTMDEIDQLTEADSEAEIATEKAHDDGEFESASADSAADNVGGVYDETNY